MSLAFQHEQWPPGPLPQVLTVSEASRLIQVVCQGRTTGSIVQLLAAGNGEGTSTLASDLAQVAGATNGLRTLLLASEPASCQKSDWTHGIYGGPTDIRPIADSPDWLDSSRVGDTTLVLAIPVRGAVLHAPAWTALLRQLRPVFDLVIIDSPALERAFTGVMLAAHVDATVMVIAAESTRASAARMLRDCLHAAGGHTAGVILNKQRFHAPRPTHDRR